MADEESSSDVLERTFFWTMVMGVLFVGSGFVISMMSV